MPKRKWFYIWLIPLIYAGVSLLSFQYPGDEYGLWAISSMPGIWIGFFIQFGDIHSPMIPLTIAAVGAAMLTPFGLLMDIARINKLAWLVLWPLAAVALFAWAVLQYPSIERALAKNGSWAAYIFAAANLGLYADIILAFIGKGLACLYRIAFKRR